MNRNTLIKEIKKLIKRIDKINAEAIDVLNGRTSRDMNDIRYSMYYINEFVGNLEDIKEVLGPINYGLGMAEPEPHLDSLRDELAYKYEKMYDLFERVHAFVFKK